MKRELSDSRPISDLIKQWRNSVIRRTSYQLCVMSFAFLGLSACGIGDSAPTDQQVKEKVIDWVNTKNLGEYGGDVKDELKLKSITNIDKMVEGNRAKVIVKAEFECLRTRSGGFGNGRYERYFGKGNGACQKGQTKVAEMNFMLEKFDSGWR